MIVRDVKAGLKNETRTENNVFYGVEKQWKS